MIGGTLAFERNAGGGASVTVTAPKTTGRKRTNQHHARKK
jgi:hypothetical protein